MLHPFYGPEGRRAILPEIEAYIAERIHATPVYGFAEMIDAGEARCGGERISGFMERYDLREWLLPLTASKGMRWAYRARGTYMSTTASPSRCAWSTIPRYGRRASAS